MTHGSAYVHRYAFDFFSVFAGLRQRDKHPSTLDQPLHLFIYHLFPYSKVYLLSLVLLAAMATRPKPAPRAVQTPSTPGGPLRSSQTPNLAYPFLADSPSHFLAPKDGAVKLKVKAGISPEARSRIGVTPSGLRPVTPRPIKRVAPPVSVPARSRMERGMTPSGSDDSLKAYARVEEPQYMGREEVGHDAQVMAEDEDALGESEAVLVTVRCVPSPMFTVDTSSGRWKIKPLAEQRRVRPPNPAETHPGSQSSVWETNEWNTQTIKLAKESIGTRDDREWTFGESLWSTPPPGSLVCPLTPVLQIFHPHSASPVLLLLCTSQEI
jgi:hypothetical protein